MRFSAVLENRSSLNRTRGKMWYSLNGDTSPRLTSQVKHDAETNETPDSEYCDTLRLWAATAGAAPASQNAMVGACRRQVLPARRSVHGHCSRSSRYQLAGARTSARGRPGARRDRRRCPSAHQDAADDRARRLDITRNKTRGSLVVYASWKPGPNWMSSVLREMYEESRRGEIDGRKRGDTEIDCSVRKREREREWVRERERESSRSCCICCRWRRSGRKEAVYRVRQNWSTQHKSRCDVYMVSQQTRRWLIVSISESFMTFKTTLSGF